MPSRGFGIHGALGNKPHIHEHTKNHPCCSQAFYTNWCAAMTGPPIIRPLNNGIPLAVLSSSCEQGIGSHNQYQQDRSWELDVQLANGLSGLVAFVLPLLWIWLSQRSHNIGNCYLQVWSCWNLAEWWAWLVGVVTRTNGGQLCSYLCKWGFPNIFSQLQPKPTRTNLTMVLQGCSGSWNLFCECNIVACLLVRWLFMEVLFHTAIVRLCFLASVVLLLKGKLHDWTT